MYHTTVWTRLLELEKSDSLAFTRKDDWYILYEALCKVTLVGGCSTLATHSPKHVGTEEEARGSVCLFVSTI